MDMTKKEEFCFSLFCNFTRHLCRQLAVEILFTKFTKESFFFSEDVFLNFCRNASYNDFWESFMTWINLKIGFQVASVLWLGSSNFGVSCFFLLLGSASKPSRWEKVTLRCHLGCALGTIFSHFFRHRQKMECLLKTLKRSKQTSSSPGGRKGTGESNKANVANICRISFHH